MNNKTIDIKLINKDDEQYAHDKLQVYYTNKLIPAEKKTYLTHLKKSQGPYMGIETPQGETHYLMDAASQIATLGLGFNPSVFMGTAHYQEAWSNNQQGEDFQQVRKSFEAFLERKTNWQNATTLFCNSGAEANEIALGLCYQRRYHPKANKVLAFEGSFHGRMLLSLFSTWNQSKREPFQVPGLETIFCPYPELEGSEIHQKFPSQWREFWDHSPKKDISIPKEWTQDPHLKTEIDCLLQIRNELLKKNIFAIIIEPMQCEGGDRYSSDRFHTALLLMAKSFQVKTVYDEVQTGFHLGREFFWHRQFNLKGISSEQINPDYLVCAKKAQVGFVTSPHQLELSNIEKREQYQAASVIRGYLHGLALDQAQFNIHKLEQRVLEKLEPYTQKYNQFIERPRALGLSFAFDLKNTDDIAKFINQRFEHGLLYYPAGQKTLRFRLNTSFSSFDLDFLFERLDALAQSIFLGKQQPFHCQVQTIERKTTETYHWQELFLETKLKMLKSKAFPPEQALPLIIKAMKLEDHDKLVIIGQKNYPQYRDSIQELQKLAYEPARQTSEERFRVAAENPKGVCLVLESKGQIKAMAFSSPLKNHPLERGLRQDPHFHEEDSLYMLDTTVHPTHQGEGWGRQMKYALTLLAMSKGVKRIKGRNRDKLAAGMLTINLSLGAHEQFYLKEDYPDFENYRDVFYYASNLKWQTPNPYLAGRIDSPLDSSDLDEDYLIEQLPFLTNKVCLSNFVSPSFLTHTKSILQMAPPTLQHGYTASGQSECVDKIFKSLWYQGHHKSRFLTFQDHYFGKGSFLSRALSGAPTELFEVDILPHPSPNSWEEILADIRIKLDQYEYSGIWLEPIRQRDLAQTPLDFLKNLKELLENKKIPLLYNETSSQMFSYSDQHYFAANNPQVTPTGHFAFLGGQAGIVMLKEDYFVEKPLMMISTWDGDEFSFAQYHRAMNNILNNKNEFFSIRKKFQKELERKLEDYPLTQLNLRNGQGIIKGTLPLSFQKLFRQEGDSFVVDPNYAEMKRFIGH